MNPSCYRTSLDGDVARAYPQLHQSTTLTLRRLTTASLGDCDGGGGGGGGGSTYPPPSPIYNDDGSWTGQQEYLVDETAVYTVQAEADSLQATPAEYERLTYYESFSLGNDGGYHVQGASSIDDLIRAAANGEMPGEVGAQLWGGVVYIPLGVGAFFVPRILFSKWRAESASASYYPALNPGDTKRDAFRHIYVNVMLRRYCSGPIAKAIMDWNEWGNANWGARVMDYHNNDLGREVKYQHFRGHWFWDRWSWGVWGHNVRRYVDDSRNAAYLPSLLDANITESAARSVRQTVPGYLYIYIRE